MELREYVTTLVRGIVSHPDEVTVEETHDDLGVLMTVNVAPEDMGTVIGKKGNTAGAIRDLARVAGSRQKAKVSIKIIDPRLQNVVE